MSLSFFLAHFLAHESCSSLLIKAQKIESRYGLFEFIRLLLVYSAYTLSLSLAYSFSRRNDTSKFLFTLLLTLFVPPSVILCYFLASFVSMSCVLARTGRHRQRYDNNLRLVSGCIPYRMNNGSNSIEVLMVSSPNRDYLVFPKGGWENDETLVEAACREALEEAGVRGKLREKYLGVWEFRSKSSQDICSPQGGCKGYMFALEVTEELEIWPEQANRHRKWLNIREAFRLCRYEWMRMALEIFLRVMTEEGKLKIEIEEDATEPLEALEVDVVEECGLKKSTCFLKPSNTSHLVGLCNEAIMTSKAFQFEKEQTVT